MKKLINPCMSLLVLVFCGYGVFSVSALEPDSARGYVNVVTEFGARNDGTEPEATTLAIQKAVNHARENRKVVYFPSGTYVINDKVLCHEWTTYKDPDQLCNVLVGSTQGARPVIKLAPNSKGYENAKSPKAMLEFKNFFKDKPTAERPNSSYFQMLRGIDLDCGGSTNPGAYGAYFNAAQNASIEDVKVIATGAFAGFVGLPGRAWGAVNIEVEGGQYGVDTVGTSAAGIVIAGAVFKNQTVSAIRCAGFAPLALVGFEIQTPAGSNRAALSTIAGGAANANCVNLIDGKIVCSASPGTAAINNAAGKNIYLRNVFVSGAKQVVKSGAQPAVGASGDWTRIEEYSYCDPTAENVKKYPRKSQNLIDGQLSETPEVSTVLESQAPPEDLVLRHRWVRLPSLEDADCVDATEFGIAPGNVSAVALQKVIDTHQKIFLRPGLYKLDGTVTLGSKTVLFGAARHLTQITHNPSWKVKKETPVFTTVDDPEATTYLGDLSMGYGVAKGEVANSWFCLLDWKAGRNSMVHTGSAFAIPPSGGAQETNARSLLKVSGSGGGRWYFPGCHESNGMKHPDFRIFEAENTTQPLWIYGLNAEHPSCERYTEFAGSNIRIYGAKSEDRLDNTCFDPIVTFSNAKNAALFGHGALRDGPGENQGSVEVIGQSDRILITLVVPQTAGQQADGFTVLDKTGAPVGSKYPNCVSLFKRGNITAQDEAVMTHDPIDYGPAKVVAPTK